MYDTRKEYILEETHNFFAVVYTGGQAVPATQREVRLRERGKAGMIVRGWGLELTKTTKCSPFLFIPSMVTFLEFKLVHLENSLYAVLPLTSVPNVTRTGKLLVV